MEVRYNFKRDEKSGQICSYPVLEITMGDDISGMTISYEDKVDPEISLNFKLQNAVINKEAWEQLFGSKMI